MKAREAEESGPVDGAARRNRATSGAKEVPLAALRDKIEFWRQLHVVPFTGYWRRGGVLSLKWTDIGKSVAILGVRLQMMIARPLLRLYRMTPKRRRLLLRATVTVTAASAAVALLPFRRAIRFGSIGLGAAGEHGLEDCVWAIGLASRRVPWRAKCIEQGLAVQRMLRSAGLDAILHYGARHHPESGKLEAHVWVTVGERVVIGGAEAAEFAPVATYP